MWLIMAVSTMPLMLPISTDIKNFMIKTRFKVDITGQELGWITRLLRSTSPQYILPAVMGMVDNLLRGCPLA